MYVIFSMMDSNIPKILLGTVTLISKYTLCRFFSVYFWSEVCQSFRIMRNRIHIVFVCVLVPFVNVRLWNSAKYADTAYWIWQQRNERKMDESDNSWFIDNFFNGNEMICLKMIRFIANFLTTVKSWKIMRIKMYYGGVI